MNTLDKILSGKKFQNNQSDAKEFRKIALNGHVYTLDYPKAGQLTANSTFNFQPAQVMQNFMPLFDAYMIATGQDVFLIRRYGDIVRVQVCTAIMYIADYWLDINIATGQTNTFVADHIPNTIKHTLQKSAQALLAALHTSNLIATNRNQVHHNPRPYTYRGKTGKKIQKSNITAFDPTKIHKQYVGPKRKGVSGWTQPSHERRGHWRTYKKTGKRIWVHSYQVH